MILARVIDAMSYQAKLLPTSRPIVSGCQCLAIIIRSTGKRQPPSCSPER
jgi:hypothetical protein